MAGEIEIDSVPQIKVNLDKLRHHTRQYIEKHQHETALFWADKLVSLSSGDYQDLYWYAQCLYNTGQFHRAMHLIRLNQLDKKFLICQYLAAKCHFECKEYPEALDILDQQGDDLLNKTSDAFITNHPSIPCDKIESSINLLRGKIYEAMENRELAAQCFREALIQDVYCCEAFDCLVKHHLLSAQEELCLIDTLPFNKQCSEEEIDLLRFLYENKLKKYHKPSEIKLPPYLEKLHSNLDTSVSIAERHYYNCDFGECYKITQQVLNKDPFNAECLPLHIAVLAELKKPNALFYLAHKLVDLYPNKAVAWFAVGCYYLLVGKNEPARRYLSKATSLDRVYGPAWLAFGHSFAIENEHDQAMAAYFTASQLMKGCHLPVLYIGLEYGLTNNTKLAEQFFQQALKIAPDDPFVLHEIGVIAFKNNDWEQAESFFRKALSKVEHRSKEIPVKWEPLLNNLGQVCRKLSKYDEALVFHDRALALSPQNPSTLSAIGFVYSLMGNNKEAVSHFHRAVGLRRDDTFSTTMLTQAIEQLMTEMSPVDGVPDELPAFPYKGKLSQSFLSSTEEKSGLSILADTADSTEGNDSSVLNNSRMIVETGLNILADTADSTEGNESSILNSSSMMIETDMEDV